ncbi:MAG: D-alanyl-D-alanine carboxypeptidase/D-alanyl-D-alanine-endopeptidase, partial [Flavisolibacter sp.]
MRSFSILLIASLIGHANIDAQTVSKRLQSAWTQFEKDSQLASSMASLYVIDAKTGKVVFDKNSTVGLAPASTQKVITSATAYELLGKDFRYVTRIGYDIGISNQELLGNLYFEGQGDPTLGSFRWNETKEAAVFKKIDEVLKKNNIGRIRGDIWIDDMQFGVNPVPDGWIWQDIGNYYGAGAWGFNWQENQYDLTLQPFSEGALTEVKNFPLLGEYMLGNFISTGRKGSGDNGCIYFAPYSKTGFATGTIPEGVKDFTISGSIPQPARQFGLSLASYLSNQNISFSKQVKIYSDSAFQRKPIRKMMLLLDSISSPSFDSINYWFLKKSINLYGEALLKTFSHKKFYQGNTEEGTKIVKEFWKNKGIAATELNMVDGSGLSPLNRVTTHAQVTILQYARKQDWFPGYFYAFPEYNGMKMKSGTINNVKGFCGYHTSKDGHQ